MMKKSGSVPYLRLMKTDPGGPKNLRIRLRNTDLNSSKNTGHIHRGTDFGRCRVSYKNNINLWRKKTRHEWGRWSSYYCTVRTWALTLAPCCSKNSHNSTLCTLHTTPSVKQTCALTFFGVKDQRNDKNRGRKWEQEHLLCKWISLIQDKVKNKNIFA
jgi:hypothetical protein